MNKTIESLLILRKCEIDEIYKCKVCDCLLINNLNSKTVLQCKNGHTKCCWESSVDGKDGNNSNNKLKCHLCNEEYNSIRDLSNNLFLVDSFTKNIKIHCINSYSGGDSSDDDSDKEGCNEEIKIYQLESHLKQCKFHIVQCKNEQCKLEFKLKDKEKHDEICNYKQIKCTACFGNIFKKDIDEHTNKKCPELLIVCQHCNTLVKNSLVNTHLDSVCPNKLISCVYDSLNSGISSTIVGECGDNGTMVCDVFKRKDSNYHYSDKHSGTHHEIILNILSNLNSTVGKLNTTVDGLNSTVGGLNSKVTDLQNENNSLRLKVIEQQTRFDLFDLQVTNKINMLSDKLEFQAKVNSFLQPQPQQQQQQQLLSQQYPIVTSTTTGKLNSNGIGSGISNEPEYYQPVVEHKKECELEERLQDLIKLIFDVKMMKRTMTEAKFDLKKMPLGKLSKNQITKGYMVLKQIEDVISGKSGESLVTLSSRFYTLIPHAFGMSVPPLINTTQLVLTKMTMLQNLADIDIAVQLIKESESDDSNVLESHYKKLKTKIEALDHDSEEYKNILTYVKNTYKGKTPEVVSVFKIDREGESDRFKQSHHLGNRRLLWHGSSLANMVGIISNGLRIAPPEAPVSCYRFGKGIYFADAMPLSANYCRTSGSNDFCMLLGDVVLGTEAKFTKDTYMEKPQAGSHSTFALGTIEPDPKVFHKDANGMVIPYGPLIPSPYKNVSCYEHQYIVYDVSQVHLKYLLRLRN